MFCIEIEFQVLQKGFNRFLLSRFYLFCYRWISLLIFIKCRFILFYALYIIFHLCLKPTIFNTYLIKPSWPPWILSKMTTNLNNNWCWTISLILIYIHHTSNNPAQKCVIWIRNSILFIILNKSFLLKLKILIARILFLLVKIIS